MPIYEYRCQGCRKRFELIVGSDTKIHCPDCGSADVKKLLSVFAVGASASGDGDFGDCCGAGEDGDFGGGEMGDDACAGCSHRGGACDFDD
jgi:putative FmdB family regulatory protein